MSGTAYFTGTAGQINGSYDWEAFVEIPGPVYGSFIEQTNWSTGPVLPFGYNLVVAGMESYLLPGEVFSAGDVDFESAPFADSGTLVASAITDGPGSDINILSTGLVLVTDDFTLAPAATLSVFGTLQVLPGGFDGAAAVGAALTIAPGALVDIGGGGGGDGFTLGGPFGLNFTDEGALNVSGALSLQGYDAKMSFVQARLNIDEIPTGASSLIDNAYGTVGVVLSTINDGGVVEGQAMLQLGEHGDGSVLDLVASAILGFEPVDNQGVLVASADSQILLSGDYLNDGAGAVTEVENGLLRFSQGSSFTSIDAASQGLFEIGDSGTLDLGGNGGVGGAVVTFTATDGTLALSDSVATFSSAVQGFAGSDSLEVEGSNVLAAYYDGGQTVEVLEADGSELALTDMAISGRAPGALSVSNNGSDGFVSLCYLRGTRILTPTGEVAVEALKIGDVVVTRFSGMVPVRWIGRQSFSAAEVLAGHGEMPVCIRAGALGAEMPARDLYVSPGHSVLLGGVLVLARALVNGVTVTQEAGPGAVAYYNLDLGVHDCVIAEGAFAESFGDGPGLRAQFHNAASFEALYPEVRPAAALALCAPRPERGEPLGAALRPVVARAWAGLRPGPVSGFIDAVTDGWTVEGWARDASHPLLPVLLEVAAAGERLGEVLACDERDDLAAAGLGNCRFTFASPVRLRGAQLATLVVRPASGGAGLAMTTKCAAEVPGPRLRLVAAA